MPCLKWIASGHLKLKDLQTLKFYVSVGENYLVLEIYQKLIITVINI